MNIQDWFPLELTGFIFLQSKGLSRVFSNITVQKHQFFGAQFLYGSIITSHMWYLSVQFSSSNFCDLMDYSTLGFPVHHNSWSLLKLMSIESVMPSNHLMLCCPLLLLPSIFPSVRVFSNESVLCSRRPKYWSFSFSISPSNENGKGTSVRLVRLPQRWMIFSFLQ